MWIDNLNLLRKKSGLDLDELSRRSGVPKGTLSKITAGITKNPGIETVKSIVYAMGYKLEDLDDKNVKETSVPVDTKTDVRLNQIIGCYNGFNDTGKEKLASYAQDLKITGIYDKHSNVQSEMNA